MDLIKRNPLLATGTAAGLASVLTLAYQDYALFLSYGAGGLPSNLRGWLTSNTLRLISVDPFSIPPDKVPGSHLKTPLPQRQGPLPQIGPHPVPHRQLNQMPSAEMKAKLEQRFDDLAYALRLRNVVEVKQSGLERHCSAMFASPRLARNAAAGQIDGEICHIHRGIDGSVHVVLSADDCGEVIAKGWGQRHSLSGVKVLRRFIGLELPAGYTLLYAPRSKEEVDVVMDLVKAAVAFVTGVEDV